MREFTSAKSKIYSKLGQRGAIFGVASIEEAKNNEKLIILTADLALLSGLDRFINTFPDRFVNVGIAEQNMLGISAGLSAEGFLPIVTTYATFLSMRSCEQIRHYLGYMKHKVVIIGSGAGLIQAYSGNTHYTIEDLSILRAIPNLTILSPCDASEAVKAFEASLENNGPTYIRLTGGLNCPIIYKDDFKFIIGKSNVIKYGSEICIFATGVVVSLAIKAANILENIGISTKVIDMHTIKPIDKEIIIESLNFSLLVSIEEHNIIGGLGGAIAEIISEFNNSPILLRLGINDVFNTVGDYEYLLDQNRLTPEKIVEDIINKYNILK